MSGDLFFLFLIEQLAIPLNWQVTDCLAWAGVQLLGQHLELLKQWQNVLGEAYAACSVSVYCHSLISAFQLPATRMI